MRKQLHELKDGPVSQVDRMFDAALGGFVVGHVIDEKTGAWLFDLVEKTGPERRRRRPATVLGGRQEAHRGDVLK